MGGLLCGKEKFKGTLRILVLGISGSGKSTFSKQIKILYTEGFNEEERLTYVNIIRVNVLVGIKELSEQANNFGAEVEEKNRRHVRFFKENNVFDLEMTDPKVLKKVKHLWEDKAIQLAWDNCRNYQIQVSQFDYLMTNLDRISESNYVPNDEDIVRSRQRTTGAYTTRFQSNKYLWEIVDVGGQSPERTKWQSIVQEGFTTIIFFAALDEYNMESNEKPNMTKMEVSMEVFENIMHDSKNFFCCNVLFLNKIDLFKEKILSKRGEKEFNEKFPDFEDYLKNDFQSDIEQTQISVDKKEEKLFWGAMKYIENKFKSLVDTDENSSKSFVCYPTCSIERNQVDIVFKAMREFIFLSNVKESGIVF